MGKGVFVNGREIVHKAGESKVVAAFPDMCMSPPGPPTGPMPVPYADTSKAGDLKKGSKHVKVGGQPIALHGRSFYKSSPLGNEAATQNFGASPLTGATTGKTYFQGSAMDVKAEGSKVNRHLDLATSNHGSDPPGTLPLSTLERMNPAAADAKQNVTYGLRVVKVAPCWTGDAPHTWHCDRDVCGDCWEPPCPTNESEIEDEYRETQAGATEAERASLGRAEIQRKIDKNAGDIEGFEFEKVVVTALEASRDHTLVAVGYKVHCTVCHLRVELDAVTDKYVIESKKSYKAVDKSQFSKRIIPAAQHCFPDKQVMCVPPPDKVAKVQKQKLDRWGLPVKALKL